MTKHAKYSASESKQWLSCAGSKGMQHLYPEDRKNNEAANLGTAAHELLEQCLKHNYDAYERLGEFVSIKTDDDGETKSYEVDDDMVEAVQVCIDLVQSYLQKYPGAEIVLEEKIDISELCGSEMYGTADIVIHVPFERLIVIDYKHGAGVPVHIEGNTQVRYYALGAALKEDFEVADVELGIVQPRCYKVPNVQTETISIEELKSCIDIFKNGRKAAEKADKEIIKKGKAIEKHLAAGDWCTFCSAKHFCPAQHNQMIKIAQMEFSEEGELMDRPSIENLPMEQWLQVLKYGDGIKKYIDAVHSHCHNLAETGVEIPGYKLVSKVARAKFKDNDDTVIETLKEAGFEEKDIVRTSLQTLTALRKICGKDVIESMTYKPDTGTTLAPESDKRKAVVPSVISDFAED